MERIEGFFEIKGEPKAVAEARRRILTEFEDLEFHEEGHRYFLHGKQLNSVSTIGHRFIREPFDEQKTAARYAVKHGGTAEQWIKEWRCKAFSAACLGTKTHEFGESLSYLRAGHPELIREPIKPQYCEEYGYLAPLHPKEEAVVRFIEDLPTSLHLVLNEAKAYSGKNPVADRNLKECICGTFDMLYYCDSTDGTQEGFVLMDYKTNASLFKEYNRRFRKTLLPPFEDMIEEDLSLYTIQLSLYALMLEDIGLPVVERRIVWLKPDGTYQMIPVDDVSEKLRAIL